MSVVQARILDKYKCHFEKILEFLLKGLEHLSTFIQYLNELTEESCEDDEKYIAKVLFPLIEKAKTEFDEMATCAERLLQQMNSDIERCMADLKVSNDKLKKTVSDLNELEKELEGTKKTVDNANDQCRRKKEDLAASKKALWDARRKLEDAKRACMATVVVGTSTIVVSAFITIFVPPLGIAGMTAGLGTEIIGNTVLVHEVNMCSNNVRSARNEVLSSQTALERARNTKTVVENKLDSTNIKKQQIETKMEKVKTDKNRLKAYRKLIIVFAEDYKKFHHQLSDFYGKYKVLRCETSGGYSLHMLQLLIKVISVSISSLCQCATLKELCEQPMLAIMRKHLLKIECVKRQTTEQYSETRDHVVRIILIIIIFILNLL